MEWLTPTTLEPIQQAATDPAFSPTNPSSLTLAIIGVLTLTLFRSLRPATASEPRRAAETTQQQDTRQRAA